MLSYIEPIIFSLITIGVFAWAYFRYRDVYRNIKMGTPIGEVGDSGQRWKNTFLLAFGQKKMFKNFIPGILHFFIYTAFVITQIELLEIIIDGFTGSHRILKGALGGFYTFIINFIEILSVLALIATVIFLIRRNLLKVPRLVKPEMKGWPKLDGNLILYGEILLVVGIFCMNGADVVLGGVKNLAVSSWLGPALFGGLSESALHVVGKFGWWLHLLVVYAFILYLPISKHLHIALAFPNTYYAPLEEKGKMVNMDNVMNEVQMMLNPPPGGEMPPPAEMKFGAKDVTDLSQLQLLSAYSCTECGRCTANCPANQTGKMLSPRKVMMDVRDRMEELGSYKKANGTDAHDEKKLVGEYITKEELNACTTCNACVEACPVSINPLSIITELRRYLILEEANSPEEWNLMFSNIENNGAPWQFPPSDRAKWTKEEA